MEDSYMVAKSTGSTIVEAIELNLLQDNANRIAQDYNERHNTQLYVVIRQKEGRRINID